MKWEANKKLDDPATIKSIDFQYADGRQYGFLFNIIFKLHLTILTLLKCKKERMIHMIKVFHAKGNIKEEQDGYVHLPFHDEKEEFLDGRDILKQLELLKPSFLEIGDEVEIIIKRKEK